MGSPVLCALPRGKITCQQRPHCSVFGGREYREKRPLPAGKFNGGTKKKLKALTLHNLIRDQAFFSDIAVNYSKGTKVTMRVDLRKYLVFEGKRDRYATPISPLGMKQLQWQPSYMVVQMCMLLLRTNFLNDHSFQIVIKILNRA